MMSLRREMCRDQRVSDRRIGCWYASQVLPAVEVARAAGLEEGSICVVIGLHELSAGVIWCHVTEQARWIDTRDQLTITPSAALRHPALATTYWPNGSVVGQPDDSA
jgi:hypothetical protein